MPIQAISPSELMLTENRLYFIGFILFVTTLIGIGVAIGYFLPH